MISGNRRLVLQALILTAILLAFVIGIGMPVFLPPEPVSLTAVTRYRMETLCIALMQYAEDCGSFPDGNPCELPRTLAWPQKYGRAFKRPYMEFEEPSKNVFGAFRYSPSFDLSGHFLDAWGNPFLIDLDRNRGAIAIKSFGANRHDDEGKVDDIVLRKFNILPSGAFE